MQKVNYSSYKPITVEDEYGNKYICLSTYEATAIKVLLERLHRDKSTHFDTGDWFRDLPLKINRWLEGDSNAEEKNPEANNQKADPKSS